MNHREKYEQQIKRGLQMHPREDIIQTIVNGLIDSMYLPVEGYNGITKRDPERCKLFGIEEEPMNWGDLKCYAVEAKGEEWIVSIDEAAPNECPTFCAYIEKYMLSYGWPVQVETEW